MKASSLSVKVLASALVLASTMGVASAKNLKGEASFKDMPACPPPVMLKDGFYLGAQAGYDSYRIRETISSPSTSGLIANPVINNTGWVGGLFLGYGQNLSDLFYLGGELFANVNGGSDQNFSTNSATYISKVTNNAVYGLALMPGLRLNDTSLGYIKLGWNWANIKSVESTTAASANTSNTLNGFNFGLGMETLLMTNWSVRTEFNHTWYSSFTSASPFKTTFNPSDNQFTLGLLYHFS